MRCFVISDNLDTLVGMRLAGMEGVVVHERAEALQALRDAKTKPDIAVVMLTEKITALIAEEVQQHKEQAAMPLLVTVPDRHGSADMTAAISRYLAETVGIHI
ncbi:MAG: V-type ATP synthase subunit F [Oscillospiraceae bacterium]|nr:V-type ATP synthase subunit F [Oscillospiraceae bacterium]